MRLRLLTITHKVPQWVQLGYLEYAKRLPLGLSLELVEIPAEKRFEKADLQRIKSKERQKLQDAVKSNHYLIALDVKGKKISSETLSKQLKQWQQQQKGVDFLIGGPEGLDESILKQAHECWSLSDLTFPHILIRILMAEQLYRASMMLTGHPYHR